MNAPGVPPQDRILLIDDDEQVAGSLREYLTRHGSLVDVALEPSSAQTLMRAGVYDVVLVDPFLTGGVHEAGGALLASIRELQPCAALIVLTGYPSAALEEAAAGGRLTTLLNKPQSVVSLSELLVSASQTAISIKGQPQ